MTQPEGRLRADCITEYETLVADLASAAHDRSAARVYRQHPLMWEPDYVTAARLGLAAAYDALADAREAFRHAAKRGLTQLTDRR